MKNNNISESNITKYSLIGISLFFVIFFLIIPLFSVFFNALEKGYSYYFNAIQESDAISAMKLSLIALCITVPLNLIFGIAASYLIARFNFFGKSILTTLIDIPFSVSPVISGLLFIILFGSEGILGEFLQEHDIKIIFSTPGIVLVTIFVTFPFIARELLPIMQSLGKEEEEASLILGANGWQTFFYITLPNIKWGLLYGVILCSARAMGEFGAVSVVSGHIRGLTNTIPLHVEILYNEYNYVGAFAVASILAMLSILSLFLKEIVHHYSDNKSL
jgi:sulfate/thiosulfate transport system permease protein